MIPIAFRIDVIDEKPSKDDLQKYFDHYEKVLCYHEVADKTKKPHYQGIVWLSSEGAFNAAKVRWSTYFKSHTKGHKSFTKVLTENYETYISKDKDVQFSKGYTEDDIKLLQDKSYKKGKKDDASSDRFTQVLNYVKKNMKFDASDAYKLDNQVKICMMLLEYYRERCRCECNDFQLRCMTKSIVKHLIYEGGVMHYESYLEARSKEILGI